MRANVCALLVLAMTLAVSAGARRAGAERRDARHEASGPAAGALAGRPGCLGMLDRLGVRYEPATRRGIETAVRIRDRIIGGIEYRSYTKKPLVLECSLVVSLAVAGRFLHAHGVERVTYSSAYQRRKVRGTSNWSKHSFGLAIDIHTFDGVAPGTLQIRNDYEQGLGDVVDCVGTPLTRGGAILRTLSCQLSRSELFYMVLTPDYDAAHYNHFHLEARPWDERADLDALQAPPASGPDAGDSAE